MEFDDKINEYLIGDKFSNGLLTPISKKEITLLDRLTILENMTQDKNVIHLGCVDHLPLLQKKLDNDTWLHKRLNKSAKRCLGVDINQEGINYLQNQLGYKDVICADILLDDVSVIKEQIWDYMILGEILEHIDNPIIFLNTINKKFSGHVERLIISVPNAFAWLNFHHVLKHQEFINSDHRYWFTPYTLGKLVTIAGMRMVNFQFCESYLPGQLSWKGKLRALISPRDFILKRYPAFRETLLAEVSL